MSTIHVPGFGRHAERHSALSIRLAAACAVLLFARLCSAQLGTVTLISPLNGVNIATTTPTLAWAAFPGARTYWVQVYQYAQQVYSSPYTTNTQITVSPALPTGVELNWYVVANDANGNPIAASDKWTFTVNGPPVLSISKRHAGNFTQGQTGATYTVTVSNQAGAGPTSTLVVVTETIPSGLSLVSMAGTGWTCAAGTCSRSDALAGGASYPPITVTVNVAGNATSPQVNAVRLSFGISGSANTTDSTIINPSALTVTCSAPPNGTVGTPYSWSTCTPSGGTAPYAWSWSGTTPPGLSINSSSGAVSGTPTTAGSYPVTVTVTDSSTPTRQTASQQFTIIINPSTLTVTCSAPLAGTVGTPYFWSTCTPSGGTAPYAWSWSGTTPPGLSISSSSGAVSGTPTTAGSYGVTITVTDSSTPTRQTASHGFAITINPSALMVTCSAPPSGTVGTPYSASPCTASGGATPYTWSWSGTIPPGLSINSSSGAVSGTPTTAGSYPVTVTVTDSSTPTKQTASQQFTVTINAKGLTVACTAPASGTVGTSYSSAACTASGGATPYTWSWSGTIPPGLSINSSSGAIGGTPTTAGSYPVTVTVTDSTTPTKQTASATVTISVLSAPQLSCNPTSGPVMVGIPYTAICTVSGGAPAYTFSLSAGSLPSGLTPAAAATTYTISGKPAAPGAYSYTVQVKDSVGQLAAQSFSGTISPAASVGSFTLAAVASAANQYTTNLTLSSAPPTALSGTLCLTFSANPSVVSAGAYQSQEVVFANGTTNPACSSTLKTTLAFTVPAGNTAAVWSGNSSQFSQGTVAGTITVTMNSLVDLSGNSVLPSPPPSQTVTVAAGAPALTGSPALTVSSSSVTVVFDAVTPTRAVTGATYVFNPGSSQPITATVSFTSGPFAGADQSQWFGTPASLATGGSFSLSATFSCTNCSALTAVQVTFTN
jgi:hypothetical protein